MRRSFRTPVPGTVTDGRSCTDTRYCCLPFSSRTTCTETSCAVRPFSTRLDWEAPSGTVCAARTRSLVGTGPKSSSAPRIGGSVDEPRRGSAVRSPTARWGAGLTPPQAPSDNETAASAASLTASVGIASMPPEDMLTQPLKSDGRHQVCHPIVDRPNGAVSVANVRSSRRVDGRCDRCPQEFRDFTDLLWQPMGDDPGDWCRCRWLQATALWSPKPRRKSFVRKAAPWAACHSRRGRNTVVRWAAGMARIPGASA